MKHTRRDLGYIAIAGAVALGASGLFLSHQSLAESADQAAVDQAVEAFRLPMKPNCESSLRMS